MPFNYQVHINFSEDWKRYLKMQLETLGYKIDENLDLQEISYNYFNWIRRNVLPQIRRVYKSNEFTCPQKHLNGLKLLEEKIIKGEHIWPHLSRKLKDLDYNDDLLNDWGIHHLHLGEKVESDGYIKRTGLVLFARFDKSNAYLIDVMDHHSFTKQKMIKVIHRNWPDSIENFRLKGVHKQNSKLTDDNIASFRKSGVLSLIEVEPGVVYAPPGMGLTTAKTSVQIGTEVDFYTKRIRQFENHVRSNVGKFAQAAKKKGHHMGHELRFHLLIDENNEVYANEILSQTSFYLGSINGK
ncbi:hypothetical protein [Peribacillus sp. NPDC058075]|uniref:hypothetical protein n=1 Tax=unclassified Peribacillus TaxID=2675266 RepID=UPI0036DF6548